MNDLTRDFDRTLAALEAGLHVQHIAEFPLVPCHLDELVAEKLDDPQFSDYDQFPVEDDNRIIGVLLRSADHAETRVAEAMCPLDSSMLVSDSQPIEQLLDGFGRYRFRLVVRGSNIEGIVTPSDLLKLPVRLYVFMLITHLEMVMAARIRSEFQEHGVEKALCLLSAGRRESVQNEMEKLKDRKLDLDAIEGTQFCDKREILRKHLHKSGAFKQNLEEIEKLRNSLAHASTYLSDDVGLEDFLGVVKITREYTKQIRGEDFATNSVPSSGA